MPSSRKANTDARREQIQAAILDRAKAALGAWVRLTSLFKPSTLEYKSASADYYRNGWRIDGVEFTDPARMREVWFRLSPFERLDR